MTVQHPIRRRLRRVLGLTGVGLLVVSGLVLGGTHQAAALPEEGDPPDRYNEPPLVQNVRTEGNTAYVTFVDNSARESGYSIEAWGNPRGETWTNDKQGPVQGHGRVATGTVTGIPPGVPICAKVRVKIDWDDVVGAGHFIDYLDSNTVCTDPVTAPSDVALQNIRGNVNPQASASPAYLVVLRNPGGNDATGVTVNVSTSGVATLGDQAAVAGGWAANGFSCASRPPSGGETSALTCTGGNLKKGEETAPAVIVRFTGPGSGAIHAQVSGAGDNTPGNNGTALNVTAG
jgi:hypothetical protein